MIRVTDEIFLREIADTDIEKVHNLLTNFETMEYSPFRISESFEDTKERAKKIKENDGIKLRVIATGDEIIGMISSIDNGGSRTVNILTYPKYWVDGISEKVISSYYDYLVAKMNNPVILVGVCETRWHKWNIAEELQRFGLRTTELGMLHMMYPNVKEMLGSMQIQIYREKVK